MGSLDIENELKTKGMQVWVIPIKLQSYANISGHWTKSLKRKKAHNSVIDWHFMAHPLQVHPPARVHLIRIAPRKLDEDNLHYAFKNILDKVGQKLMPHKKVGHADGSGELEVIYGQTKGNVREYKIIIAIEAI